MRPASNTKEAAEFIASFIEENGYSPSFREIAAHLNINVASAHWHVHKLLEDGRISMVKSQPRTIRMIAEPRVQM